MLSALERFAEAGHSWLIECAALFLIPFLHEDVAIWAGSLMVVEHRLPIPLALLSLYTGMISSDLLLYGIGALTRRSQWVRRMMLRPRIERLGLWLGKHLGSTVALARVVPGLMFPVYIGCGVCGVRLVRFAAATMLTAAIYLPIIFFLVVSFGRAVLSDLGYWSWFVAMAIFAISVFNWARNPSWRLLLRVSTSGGQALLRRVSVPVEQPDRVSHAGMPPLGALPRRVAFAETIPPVLFYIPLGLQWIWLGLRYGSLSLPTVANPKIEVGGLWGESKSSYLRMVGDDQRHWIAEFTTLRRSRGVGSVADDSNRAIQSIAAAGLSFPLVAKPDIGWRGYGVRLIADAAELERYLEAFPEAEVVILQRAIPHEGEAGVLYARMPGEPCGRIPSLTLRYFPYVVGDGRTPLRDLILHDQRAAWKAAPHLGLDPKHLGTRPDELDRVPAAGAVVRLSFIGSNRVGGLYRDASEHITPAMVRRFDAISRSMPEFYYGRYDVRFGSIKRFREGEDFSIIEINGAGGESINVWDPSMPLSQVYHELFEQQRLLFEIGACNRARGYHPCGLWAIARSQWRQHRLILRYPPSS